MKRANWRENNYTLVLGAIGVLEQESDADNSTGRDNLGTMLDQVYEGRKKMLKKILGLILELLC